MAWMRSLAVMGAGLLVAWLLMPGEPEPPPRPPASILGAAPQLPVGPAAPERVAAASAPVLPAEATAPPVAAPGPFAPRPRPPAVVSFGAAAPLAAGQDASAYHWGGVKPDLSD